MPLHLPQVGGMGLTPFLVRVSCDLSGFVQLGRKVARRQVSERGMRPGFVVIGFPAVDPCSSVVHGQGPRLKLASPASSSSKAGTTPLADIRLWGISHRSTMKGMPLKGWNLQAHNRPRNRGNSNTRRAPRHAPDGRCVISN